MNDSSRRTTLAALAIAAAFSALPPASRAQSPGPALLTLRGFGLNTTGVGSGRSGDLEIRIERWSSDAERDALKAAFAKDGGAGLARAVPAAARVGSVRTQRGGLLDLKYAREIALPDGGRRVVLATDRLSAPKDGTNPNAEVHDFLAVEIRLDKAGKGQGRTSGPGGLRMSKDGQTLELDSYGASPVWIEKLQVVGEAER